MKKLMLVLALLCPAITVVAVPASCSEKRNVLLLLSDELGWQELVCYDSDENNYLVSYPQIVGADDPFLKGNLVLEKA